jgi:hypothetical protein
VLQIFLEYIVLDTQVIPCERNPGPIRFVAFPHACNNDGNDAPYVRLESSMAGLAPGSQIMPNLDAFKPPIPVRMDHHVKYVPIVTAIGMHTSDLEASSKSTSFDVFGY